MTKTIRGRYTCIHVLQGIFYFVKMTRREFAIFIIFSDTYACSHVVWKIRAVPIKIFYKL